MRAENRIQPFRQVTSLTQLPSTVASWAAAFEANRATGGLSSRGDLYRMNRAQLTLYFALSLGIGLPISAIGMLLWTKRVWSRIRKNTERYGGVEQIAVMSLFYVSPGLLFLLACLVPAIYFSHLLKQQLYCVEVIRINRGITQDHADLKARCGYFDMNELFAMARGGP